MTKLTTQKLIYHQNNAYVHTSAVAMVKLKELTFELLWHALYSSELIPGDIFLFRNLKT